MGKKLDELGKGEPQVDPEICQHPQDQVIRKSNKNANTGKGMDWWLCKVCKTRWARLQISDLNQDSEPRDSDVYPLGKHAGKTYVEILTNHPSYAAWIIQTAEEEAESHEQLKRFAAYLVQSQTDPVQRSSLEAMDADTDQEYPWIDTEDQDL